MPSEDNSFNEFYQHLQTTDDPAEVLSAIVACAIKRRVTPHNISELERGIKAMQEHVIRSKEHLSEVDQMFTMLEDKVTEMGIPKELVSGLVKGAMEQVEKQIKSDGTPEREETPEERPQVKTTRQEEMDDSIPPPSAWNMN
jgi:chromosome segregation ATPase